MKATSKKQTRDHRTNQAKPCESWTEGAKQEEHSFREKACELGFKTQFLKEMGNLKES